MSDNRDGDQLVDAALAAMRAIQPPPGPSPELAEATLRRMRRAARGPAILSVRTALWAAVAAAVAAMVVIAWSPRHEPAAPRARIAAATPLPAPLAASPGQHAPLEQPLFVILEDEDSYSILDVSTSVPIISVWPRRGMSLGIAVPLMGSTLHNPTSQKAL